MAAVAARASAACARGLLAATCLAVLAACTLRTVGKQPTPDFQRDFEEILLRVDATVAVDDGVAFSIVEASMTRVSTVLGVEECRYHFRIEVENTTSAATDRLRRPAFSLHDERGGVHPLSGPYGCGDGALEAREMCVAVFVTTVAASACAAAPAAIVLGGARRSIGR